MYKDIEFVCTGNNTRSVILEATANHVARVNRYDLNFSSSGTLVDSIDTINDSEIIHQIGEDLEKAVRRGVLNDVIVPAFYEDPRAILGILLQRERGIRQQMIEKNLGYCFKHQSKQTVVRPEAELILTVTGDNWRRLQQIYENVERKPDIQLVNDFIDSDFNFEEEWPASYEDSKRMALMLDVAARQIVLKLAS